MTRGIEGGCFARYDGVDDPPWPPLGKGGKGLRAGGRFGAAGYGGVGDPPWPPLRKGGKGLRAGGCFGAAGYGGVGDPPWPPLRKGGKGLRAGGCFGAAGYGGVGDPPWPPLRKGGKGLRASGCFGAAGCGGVGDPPWPPLRKGGKGLWAVAVGLVMAMGIAGASAADEPADKVDFNRQVRPILAKNCFPCHGQDEAKRAKGLRLDRRDSAVGPLKNGDIAIVPGDPDSSELILRITEEDNTMRMPPAKAGNRLTSEEVGILRTWIEQGAEYAAHWAFDGPKPQPVPRVADRSWPRNGIDCWILDRLQREGLKPSPEASRAVLLRRLSLDLRGLPPTLREVEAFVADQAGDAYERVVDQFLADPAYGERWARVWLDQARYADSAGYGSDPLRPDMWRYRDWVIAAFNRNLPFDQFTLWQIAGDLLKDATPRAEDGDGISPQHHDQHRGGHRRRRVSSGRDQGPGRHDDAGLHGIDHGLCQVPQPQVRSDHTRRILSILCNFQPDC